MCDITGDLAKSVLNIAEAIKQCGGTVSRDDIEEALHSAMLKENEFARERLVNLESSIEAKTKEGFEAATVFFTRVGVIYDQIQDMNCTINRSRRGGSNSASSSSD
jgi:hypothetical protein